MARYAPGKTGSGGCVRRGHVYRRPEPVPPESPAQVAGPICPACLFQQLFYQGIDFGEFVFEDLADSCARSAYGGLFLQARK